MMSINCTPIKLEKKWTYSKSSQQQHTVTGRELRTKNSYGKCNLFVFSFPQPNQIQKLHGTPRVESVLLRCLYWRYEFVQRDWWMMAQSMNPRFACTGLHPRETQGEHRELRAAGTRHPGIQGVHMREAGPRDPGIQAIHMREAGPRCPGIHSVHMHEAGPRHPGIQGIYMHKAGPRRPGIQGVHIR